MRLKTCAALALGLLLLVPKGVRAETPTCDVGDRDLVLVEIASSLDPVLNQAALAHLVAELATRHIAVCSADAENAGAKPALARVYVTGSEAAFVNVRVQDDRTQTTVERVFDFSQIPPAGRAMTLGLASNALLSMLWSLPPKESKPTPPAPPAPPAQVAQVQTQAPSPVQPAQANRRTATVLGTVSDYRSGPAFYGPQIQLRRMAGRWLPTVFAGFRRGSDLYSDNGRVAFQDVHLGLELGWLATRAERPFALAVYGGTELSRVSVAGQAEAGSIAGSGYGVAVAAYGGVEASLALATATRLVLRAGGGHALRPVEANDAGQAMGGVKGFLVSASLGVGVSF